MQYELFYLVGASKEAELDTIKSEVTAIITAEEGVFEAKQVIEKRKMAYDIKHENRGFYVAQRFNLSDPTKIQEMTRNLNLYTKILRSIITKTDELPELTSREERDAMAKSEAPIRAKKVETQNVASTPKKVVGKNVEAKSVETQNVASVPAEKTEEKKTTSVKAPEKKETTEDIDKKLEEILNI